MSGTGKPSVLVVSSSNTKPKSLLRLLTKSLEIPGELDPKIVEHPWSIDTKYYRAEVNLIGINEEYQRNQEFNENVEALIILMDSNRETGLSDLSKWDTLRNDCGADVQLLVASYCNQGTKITKSRATEWCLKRGFELIELYPTPELEPDDSDGIIEEKVGVDRIIEALQAHMWSNLEMKDQEEVKPEVRHEEVLLGLCEGILKDDPTEKFYELFSNLGMMKDGLQSLPDDQRKLGAEQMLKAFWNAIEGAEEEVADV